MAYSYQNLKDYMGGDQQPKADIFGQGQMQQGGVPQQGGPNVQQQPKTTTEGQIGSPVSAGSAPQGSAAPAQTPTSQQNVGAEMAKRSPAPVPGQFAQLQS